MSPEEKFESDLTRFMRAVGLFGWAFLVLGSCLFVVALILAFDPKGEMVINHVRTTNLNAKLGVVAFTAVFPFIGAFIVFAPRAALIRIVTPMLRQAMESMPSFLRK